MGYAGDKVSSRRLLLREIERIVADARAKGSILRTADHAARLFATYGSANFSIGKIVDELVAAAAVAKVPVEIARPDHGDLLSACVADHDDEPAATNPQCLR